MEKTVGKRIHFLPIRFETLNQRIDYWVERLCRPKYMTNEFEWQNFRADVIAFVVVAIIVCAIFGAFLLREA
jgi:hypothetical protein